MTSFPSALAYNQIPMKSMGSRVSKVEIAPRNGSVFRENGKIEIQLPVMSNSYINLQSSYLKFKIKTVSKPASLDHTGHSLINRISARSQSAVLSDLQSSNVLYSALMDLNVGSNSLKDYGFAALGSGGMPEAPHLGKPLNETTSVGMCLPFFTGLFAMDGRMLPLDTADGVTFTFQLESSENALFTLDHANLPTGYIIEDVSLHSYILTLNESAQAILDEVVEPTGYTMMYEDVAHSSDSKAVDELTKISTLGFRYSSLSRVLVTHRASANQNDYKQLSISNRSTAKMSEIGLLVGGLNVPDRPIQCGGEDYSQALSETLLSFGVLNDRFQQMSLNGVSERRLTNDASTADSYQEHHDHYTQEDGHFPDDFDVNDVKLINSAKNGSFVVAIDCDVIKNVSNTPEALYSGINSLGSTVQGRIKYSGSSTNSQIVDYFGSYNAILSLNPITRSFEVST